MTSVCEGRRSIGGGSGTEIVPKKLSTVNKWTFSRPLIDLRPRIRSSSFRDEAATSRDIRRQT